MKNDLELVRAFTQPKAEKITKIDTKFKVGDVVDTPKGKGKIVAVYPQGNFCVVYLGKEFKGHNFFGSQPNNNNFIFCKEELSLIGDK